MGRLRLVRRRRHTAAVVIGLVVLVALVSWFSGDSARRPGRWADVLHQGGAYAVFPGDLATFTRTGLTLALTNEIVGGVSADEVHYVDPRAVSDLYAFIADHYRCSQSAAPCPISAASQQQFLSAFKRELARQHNNREVVAYYILDDYVGNIRNLLEHVHRLVAADNRSSPVQRPTICGFGGTLDFRKPRLPPGQYEPDFASLAHYDRLELLNFTPQACDMVILYIYSLGHRAAASDYSMRHLMPVMLADLRARGWNPARTPLLGAPQTWEAPPPSAAEVRTQTAAFCSFGAQSIIAFTWHNFAATGPTAEPELANSPGMRSGLRQGLADCRHSWGRG